MEPEARVRLAVVGHTNAGKTSLLRTLTRNRSFGEVSIHPATTRQVEAAIIDLGADLLVELDDTPGLEDSMALLDALHAGCPDPREPGPDRLRRFLASPEANERFTQEAKALRRLLACDLALYVADAREPVTGKYEDEFVILNWAGKPSLTVLNFVADRAAAPAVWRAALQRAGLHNVAAFDTVLFDPAHEVRLFQQFALLLPRAERAFTRLAELRAEERSAQLAAAAALIGEMLVDCAALRAPATAPRKLAEQVLAHERRCNRDLLALFRFGPEDYEPRDLPIRGVEWSIDPFDAEVLKDFGLGLSSSAAKGAAAGIAIDLLTGFTSLGAATLIGGAAGAGLDVASRAGRHLAERMGGRHYERVETATLVLLARRARVLAADLARRGHAATRPVRLQNNLNEPLPGEAGLEPLLARCRNHPEWSALSAAEFTGGAERRDVIASLARLLGLESNPETSA